MTDPFKPEITAENMPTRNDDLVYGSISASRITAGDLKMEAVLPISLDYLKESARTAAGSLKYGTVHPDHALKVLQEVQLIAGRVDVIKKALAYGKTPSDFPIGGTSRTPNTLENVDANVLHGILGVISEAGELAELLCTAIMTGQPINRPRTIDESGDILWYMAMLYRAIDSSFDEAMVKNIAKLKARFPDKFEASLAINKDTAVEQAAVDDLFGVETPPIHDEIGYETPPINDDLYSGSVGYRGEQARPVSLAQPKTGYSK